jgi:hypothetical protein
VTVVASGPVESDAFSSVVGNHTLTITLNGGRYAASPALSQFTITAPGTPGFIFINLNGGRVTRTSDTVVTITGLTPVTSNGSGQKITIAAAALATQASSATVVASGSVPPPYPKATKLNGEFTVVANPGSGVAGAGNIYYNRASRRLWVGTDAYVTLEPTLDQALIADLDFLFNVDNVNNYVARADIITFAAGVPTQVATAAPYYDKAVYLLAKVNLKLKPEGTALIIRGDTTLTIPEGRSIILEHHASTPGRIFLEGESTKLVTGASSGNAATGKPPPNRDPPVFFATGPGAFADINDSCNGIGTTAAVVRSIQSNVYIIAFRAGATQDGVINANTTFKDGG